MAYKFQFGTTKLSGSTTFEEALIGGSTISGSGLVSGKGLVLDATANIGVDGDTDLLTLSMDTVNVSGDLSASLDVKGRKLTIMQNGSIGVPTDTDLITLSSNTVDILGKVSSSLGLTGSSLVLNADESSGQTIKAYAGLVSGSAVSTLYGVTTDALIAATADINGGTVDAAVIGGATAAAGTFTTLTATTLGGALDCDNQNMTNVDIDSGAIDGTNITVGSGKTLDVSGGTLTTAAAQKLAIVEGVGADTDIGAFEFRAQTLVADVADGTAPMTITSTTKVANLNVDKLDGSDWAAPAALGSTTPAAAEFTTLSASSTLNVVGASNFGPENKATISAAGVFSGSGVSTLSGLTADAVTMASASLSGPMYLSTTGPANDEILGVTTGSLMYFDEATGLLKRGTFESYATALAGTGITATNGVLSVDTTGGDSMTATHIPLASYGNAVLSTGINYMTSAATGSCSFVLPSGSAGDVVIVKAGSGVTVSNFVKISSSVGNGDQIDGFSQAIIESEHGAVSMIYSNSDGKWVIY